MAEIPKVIQVEWRPIAGPDDPEGELVIVFQGGRREERGPMTKADVAHFAAGVFEGFTSRVDAAGGVVAWVDGGSRA